MATILYKYLKKKHNQRKENENAARQKSEDFVELTPFPDRQSDSHDMSEATIPRVQTEEPSIHADTPPDDGNKDKIRTARIYRYKIIAGLFLPFLVQSLDTTIIAGALPFIASDFNQLSQLNWIVSAYNLTAACFIPSWGQFADIFGRYAAIQGALISMIFGSVLCSAAPTTAFAMLLVGRAFQGIGCAGLLIVTKIVLADKVSLEENAKNNTIFTIVGGVGYGVGPVLGGYLTQVNWRWCFIINIPIGVLGLVAAHFVLRPELLGPQKITRVDNDSKEEVSQTFKKRLLTIDYGGQVLFLFGLGLLVLALTWAGSYYPWTDVKVLAPLICSVVLIIAFFAWEYFMLPGNALSRRNPTRKAMIPFRLLFRRNVWILLYINFLTGMAMYAVFYFVDLYFALVKNFESGKAGINLLYYMPGIGAGAYTAMFICNIWPLQTFLPMFLGTVIEPLGITLLAVAINNGNLNVIYGMLALTGFGTGIRMMPGTLHGVGYFPNHIASIVSLMSLSISLGGTIAMTLMLNIFNNTLSASGITFNSPESSSFEAIGGLGEAAQAFLRDRANRGIVLAFFALTSFGWLGVIIIMWMGNVKIGKKGAKDTLIKGSYIGSLFRKENSPDVA